VEPRATRLVIVLTSRRPVEISWNEREQLVERLQAQDVGSAVVEALSNVDSNRPVELTDEAKRVLSAYLDEWVEHVSADRMPPRLLDLGNALHADRSDKGW
jgi:hypothetical protein